MNETQLTPTNQSAPIKKKRLNPKQKLALEYWLYPGTETFGNLYQSAVKAGFAPKYALNLSHLKPSWLSENVNKQVLEPEHIRQGVQQLATNENVNSRSPADTNLKAFELLGKYAGMEGGNTTHITVVQPILNGESMKHVDNTIEPTTTPTTVIDSE